MTNRVFDIGWLEREMAIQAAELDAWRTRHPREAADVREEAEAAVDKRKPKYPPAQCFG